jgi:dolichol-phosphate mannosyltransferase
VLVVDNGSTDGTAVVARAHGAAVVHEEKKGKGNAVRTGLYAISDDTDYVVMIDGDGTYDTGEIMRLLEPLDSGFADVVLGSRLTGKMAQDSMKALNRLGNWFFSALTRSVYKVNTTDTLTGYFAWRRDVIVKLRPYIVSSGFAIEMEMITKQAKLGFATCSVPITYAPRVGSSNLRPVRDGIRILTMFARQLFWSPQPGPQFEQAVPLADAVYALPAGLIPFDVGASALSQRPSAWRPNAVSPVPSVYAARARSTISS